MNNLPLIVWIGNAAAVLAGQHGDITAQTQRAGCSRQVAYLHAHRVLQAVQADQLPGPDRAQLLLDLQQLRLDHDRLRQQLQHSCHLDPDRQHRFTITAAALGLSLNQCHELLTLLLPADGVPSRATLGRWLQQAQQQATQVLVTLDDACRPLTHTLALDEIFFHGQPVLVAVEPQSYCVLVCQRTADRSGDTWAATLTPFTALQAVMHDAGTGLSAGVAAVSAQRQQHQQAALDDGLDLFHVEQEAQRVLGRCWRRVETDWYAAEAVEQRWRGARDGRGRWKSLEVAWGRAFASFRRYERRHQLWQRARAALRLFRPDGRLNDRAWAAAELAAVGAALLGPEWAKVRRYLADPRLLTFLDRTGRQLELAEPRAAVRAAVLELVRLQRQAESGPGLALAQVAVQRVVLGHLADDWPASYERVQGVLGGVVRASSCVECVNSVLRMQQGRHRNLGQGLLDLKRLYWNSRKFLSGPRRKHCPYELLGLRLPSYDFWELLTDSPQVLAQKVSKLNQAA